MLSIVVLQSFICGPVLPRHVEEKKNSQLGRHADSYFRNAELHSIGAALDLPKAKLDLGALRKPELILG